MRVRVESRLAMKVVPIMGRPRGPGGRLRGDAEAVADMSRQLLGDEIALMIRQTRGVDFVSGGIGKRRRVTCNLKGERVVLPRGDRKDAQSTEATGDRGA